MCSQKSISEFENENMKSKKMNTYYHAAEKKNLSSILTQGLIPQVRSRSAMLDEDKAVFLFKTLDDTENALIKN